MTISPDDVYSVKFVPSEETMGGYVANEVVYLPQTLKNDDELAGSFARTLTHYGMASDMGLLHSVSYPVRQYAMLIENIRCDIEITRDLNGQTDLNDIANYLINKGAFAVPETIDLFAIALLVGRSDLAGTSSLEPMAKKAKEKLERDYGAEKASEMIELVNRIADITSAEESISLAKVFNEFWPIKEPEFLDEYVTEDEDSETSELS